MVEYQRAHHVASGQYAVTGVRVSSADSSWAGFSVVPTNGYQNVVQAGYGVAHRSNGRWSIVGIGNANVGCAPGPTVPTEVLSSLGLACQ